MGCAVLQLAPTYEVVPITDQICTVVAYGPAILQRDDLGC